MVDITKIVSKSEVLRNAPYLWLVKILVELEDMGAIKEEFEVQDNVQ